MRLAFALREVRDDLTRDRSMVVAVAVTVAATLVLAGSGLLLRMQVDAVQGFWANKVEVSVFLCGPTSLPDACPGGPATETERQGVRDALESQPWVREVYFESSSQAYELFSQEFEGSPLLGNVSPDAMPESFRVSLTDPSNLSLVSGTVSALPGVDRVHDQRQALERFFSVTSMVAMVMWSLTLAMVVVSFILISNTMRVAAANRKRQTQIMRLVGASNASVRLPFLLESGAAAAAGAAFASIALIAAKATFLDSALRNALPFVEPLPASSLMTVVPVLALSGVVFTVAVASLSLRSSLRS